MAQNKAYTVVAIDKGGAPCAAHVMAADVPAAAVSVETFYAARGAHAVAVFIGHRTAWARGAAPEWVRVIDTAIGAGIVTSPSPLLPSDVPPLAVSRRRVPVRRYANE